LSLLLILGDWLTLYWSDLGVFSAPDFVWQVDNKIEEPDA
jgi:hypothetical protein